MAWHTRTNTDINPRPAAKPAQDWPVEAGEPVRESPVNPIIARAFAMEMRLETHLGGAY